MKIGITIAILGLFALALCEVSTVNWTSRTDTVPNNFEE